MIDNILREHPGDEALINLWINNNYENIIIKLNKLLKSHGFEISINNNNGKIVINVCKDGTCGDLNLTRLMINIASTQNNQNFDRNLNSSLYEACKIKRCLGNRVAALSELLSDNGSTVIDKLNNLDSKVKYVLIKGK